MISENKGILGNSQLMMVWKLWTMVHVIWQAVAESVLLQGEGQFLLPTSKHCF